MAEELSALLIAQKLVAKNVELTKSIPQYDGQTDVDEFNIQLAQFVELTKTDLKTLISMLLLRLRGQALTFIKQIEKTVGEDNNLPINTIEKLLTAFKDRFVETSSTNKLKHGTVCFNHTQNIQEYLHNVRISVEAKYGKGSGDLYEKIILNAFLQGLPPKLYRMVISKNIQTLDLAVQEVGRMIEIDLIVANHSKTKINSISESKTSLTSKGDQEHPNFFSRDKSPIPQRTRTQETARQKTVRIQPIKPNIYKSNPVIRFYNCNRVGHIAKECRFRNRMATSFNDETTRNTRYYGTDLFGRTNFPSRGAASKICSPEQIISVISCISGGFIIK
jgi:hypothetical protein